MCMNMLAQKNSFLSNPAHPKNARKRPSTPLFIFSIVFDNFISEASRMTLSFSSKAIRLNDCSSS